MGLVPKQTKTEVKMSRGLTLYRMFGLIITLMFSAMFGSSFIYSKLLLPFIIFCVVVFLILTSKAPTNPNKSFAKGLWEFITFKKNTKRFYGANSEEYIKSVQHNENKKSKKKRR